LIVGWIVGGVEERVARLLGEAPNPEGKPRNANCEPLHVQEKPLYFLLRSHVNMAAPQPVENKKAGYEYADEYSKEGHKPGEYGA
jgi:hypothetical protein